MANLFVQTIIEKIKTDFGLLKKLGDGNSLYEISSINTVIYFRYSKITPLGKCTKAFYGLRKEDLKLLQGKRAFICFVTDNSERTILIPFWRYEEYFANIQPSSDGQYKTLSFFKPTGTELYFANIGKFNVDSYFGLSQLYEIGKQKLIVPELSHAQIQSLIGAIGIKKGFDLWCPASDKLKIDSSIVNFTKLRENLPVFGSEIDNIISEIDVIWMQNSKLVSFFEVEHSTSIYSGLLRFNDVLLTIADAENFNIVAENERETKFSREINRPTFKQNKLIDKVSFLDYESIYHWYFNLYGKTYKF